MKSIRIGGGAGYSGDRIDPAVRLLKEGKLDYIVFECLAERTIALAQKRKQQDSDLGYDPLLTERFHAILSLAVLHKVKIITNMGAANPLSAAKEVQKIAAGLGISGLKIATVTGDDVLEMVLQQPNLPVIENDQQVQDYRDRIISANAYLGCEPIVLALAEGADVVITGRVADPALFLAPLVYEFNWEMNNYQLLGKGTLVGHLMECAAQVCGGYFADPGKKEIPALWDIGFPIAVVDEKGNGNITKVDGTGGLVNVATCTEQLLYEIHDPANYITPDCIADFSKVTFNEIQPNQVSFQSAAGKAPTEDFKVSIGYQNGFLATAEMSYGSTGCTERARLAEEIIRRRLIYLEQSIRNLSIDLIGFNALYLTAPSMEPSEVRLRVCGLVDDYKVAQTIVHEVEALYTNGPAGGGGATKTIEEQVSVVSILLPKNVVKTSLIYYET